MKTRIACPFDEEEGCPNMLTVWWTPASPSKGYYDPGEPSAIEDVEGCSQHLTTGYDMGLIEEALGEDEHDRWLDAQDAKYDAWRDRDV